jgi:DNA polymerase-3 subunit chi
MTRITFFHGAQDRLQTIADWLTQPEQRGKPILVFAPDAEQADKLDQLLWTHPATGFIAHCRAGDALESETPLVISSTPDSPPHDQCLLNFSNQMPSDFSRFADLIEIISIDDRDRLPGRERFRVYRERGYTLENRDISGGL